MPIPPGGRYTVRVYPEGLDAAVKDLVLQNRERLIRAAVPDNSTADKLVEINALIEGLRASDPDLVGAWGLGCGAGCAAAPGVMLGNVERPGG